MFGFFNFFDQQERLDTAMDVIGADRRTQNLFNAKNAIRVRNKIIALLIVMALAGFVMMNLPKYKDTPDGKKLERRELQTDPANATR